MSCIVTTWERISPEPQVNMNRFLKYTKIIFDSHEMYELISVLKA